MRLARAAVAAPLLLALLPAAPSNAGEPTMPLRDVRAGMHCTGASVVRGTTISSFAVEVLDVIAGDPAFGRPRILVRVSGAAVPGGIGPGFSGSPVYCRDAASVRRNIGAISEGVGDYGNSVALVTPIEEMLGESPTPPRSARYDPELRRSARPLTGPLTATGLSTRARRLLIRAGHRAGISVLAVPAGPLGGYPVQTLRPGAAVTAAFATGDVALGAVGTVAYRDGSNVWAFGHSIEAAGPRAEFLQDAYVFGVIPNPIGSPDLGLGTYKLATSGGHTVGIVTNDADSAAVGRVGNGPPTIRLEASARERGTRTASFVDGLLADERSLGLGAGASITAPLAITQAVDQVTHSFAPVTLSMCVRFRVRERRRRLGFCNDYFSLDDAAVQLTDAAALVESYDFSPVTLQEITARANLTRGVKREVLLRGRAPRRVRPGQRIRLRLVVHRRGSGAKRRLTIRMRLPRSLRRGRRTLLLTGTGTGVDEEADEELSLELLSALGEEGAEPPSEGPPEVRSLGELASRVSAFHRGLGITARFRRRGRRRLVHESDQVAFEGTVRVPLRVVRRRRR
jgi:hypothetical protein